LSERYWEGGPFYEEISEKILS